MRIIVGFTPGGFYDRWARLLSRYMPKYVPGNPNFLVQNMPGASSVIAANYVYNLSKADGLTLLVPINSLYLDQVVGRKEVKFDVRKFEFIGTQEKAPTMLYFRADSPFKTLGDIINAKEPPKCGSTGTASTGYLLARIMDEAFKAKMTTVTGYQGGSEIDIAVERGEIVCRGMDIPPHFGREPFDGWHKTRLRPAYLTKRPQARSAHGRRADTVRTDGSIQNSRSHARCRTGDSGERRFRPAHGRRPRQSARPHQNAARRLCQSDARSGA